MSTKRMLMSMATPLESIAMSYPVRGLDRNRIRETHWAWGFVMLGIFLRLLAFCMNYPLWWDEAFLAVNLLRRDYLGLLSPLDYGQVSPLLFLWFELLAVRLLGFNEWALRLFPLLCSIGGVVLFRIMAGRLLEGRSLLLAVGVFAVSIHPIQHAADVKPYATDLLVALVLQTIALEWLKQPEKSRWLWVLVGFGPMALLLSNPAIFVVGGVGLAMGWSVWQKRVIQIRFAWLMYGLIVTLAYLAIYLWFTRNQSAAASPGMKEMWFRSFPPLTSLPGFLRWLVVAHSGDMLAYPCGGENGASSLSLIACLIGCIALGRRRLWAPLGILLVPLGLAMIAAGLRLYPYGGPAPHGSASRIMQYAAPGLCLLIGLGASTVIGWIGTDSLSRRILRWSCLFLLGVGIVPPIASIRHPYRAYQAEAARNFAREFWPKVEDGAEVADLRWDFDAADWDSIHLGIAVSLCDEAIYSPSRRNGGPRFGTVSSSRPLRCVLGVAPATDGPRLAAWLERMEQSYELRKRESIRVPISEPGRRSEFERYDVFEFVPKPGPGRLAEKVAQSVKGL